MRFRHNTKVSNKRSIKQGKHEIGYLQLVSYFTAGSLPHIEFWIEEAHRNKGIMTNELKKYLKYCKKWGHTRLIAIIKEGNEPSKKLIKKNGFIELARFDDKISYVLDMNLTPEFMQVIMNAMDKRLESNDELGG